MLAFAIGLTYLARRLRIADPILLLLGGIVLSRLSGPARHRARAGPRVPPVPAADPVRGRVLHADPRLQGEPAADPPAGDRARAVHDGRRGGRRPAADRACRSAAAFALGAIVAPPDAVAATAIFRRLGVPRRIVTILEGESLLNDASALIAYRAAVVAAPAVRCAFSLGSATARRVDFVVVAVGGHRDRGRSSGAIVDADAAPDGGSDHRDHRHAPRAGDAPTSPPSRSACPGVLATVVAGLITGQRAARVLSPDARLMGAGVWQTVIWLINAFVFMLIGLQLAGDPPRSSRTTRPASCSASGLAVSATVIVARIVWVYPATYLPRSSARKLRARDPYPPARAVFIISWAGMRGVVSLAAAFALPPDFPSRDLILFLTFCVIVATLVGQGLTLPWLIRHLGVLAPAGADGEEVHARLAAVEAALQRLEELQARLPRPPAAHRPAARGVRARGGARHAEPGHGTRRGGAGAPRPPGDPERGPRRRNARR